MATLSQINNLTRVYISQAGESNSDFTNNELTGFANEGIRFLAGLVKKPTDIVSWQAEAGKAAYLLPDDFIIMRTSYFGDTSIAGDVSNLMQTTEEALKEDNPGWMEETVSSRGTPRKIILLNRTTILVYPTPDDAASASGKKIHMNYVYQPSPLVNDSDEPDLPLVYHDLISKYSAHMCYMSKLNKPELGTALLQEVMDLAKKFESLIIKDSEGSFGWNWGGAIQSDDDIIGHVRP
jgi:hypothetical protein